MKELDIIRRIREGESSGAGVRTGIGDDAAVLELAGGAFVVTTDLLVEGTHFEADVDPASLGRKALAVSFSDVAAMGCRATAAFLAVALPRSREDPWVLALLDGVREIAGEFGVPLAGGDTTESATGAALCSTVVGEPFPDRDPVLRSGAGPGDVLLVTGRLGGSISGRHLSFTPRLAEAEELMRRCRPRAMIDVSDGLSTDAWHLARAGDVGIRILGDRVPVSAEAAGREDGAAPLRAALEDGEDFELLFAVSAEDAGPLEASGLAGTPVTRIGDVVPGPASVRLVGIDGEEEELVARGYEHFG